MSPVSPTALRKPDAVCAAAVDLAREQVRPGSIGDHLTAVADGERLVTHYFECRDPGYVGWRWAVTVARAPRAKQVTVCEVCLLPGPDSLLAPDWLPWSERLQPGDLGVGDLLPTAPDDDRLVPGYVPEDSSPDPDVRETAYELGRGRTRVMSREGRLEAADRWHSGGPGPTAPIAQAAPARCGTCGFFLPLSGSLQVAFGVCGNEFAPDDARVVAVDHGCGAHSEALVEVTSPDPGEVILDDAEVEIVHVPQTRGSVDESADEDDLGHG